MDSTTFIANLPDVDVSSLTADENECKICLMQFQDSITRSELRSGTEEDSGDGPEKAVRLPCGHFFGHQCIGAWLATKNSCPICRGKLIEHMDPLSKLLPNGDSFAEHLDYLMAHCQQVDDLPDEDFYDNPVLIRIRHELTAALDGGIETPMMDELRAEILNAYRRCHNDSEDFHSALWLFWIEAVPESTIDELDGLQWEGLLLALFGGELFRAMVVTQRRMIEAEFTADAELEQRYWRETRSFTLQWPG